MSNTILKLGTRSSALAVWQAEWVATLLQQHNQQTTCCFIKSEGDINLTTPLYEMGVQGVFTRALDIALLNYEIDIAVHSYKDVPVTLAKGLQVAAVLPRANAYDMLVCRNEDCLHEVRETLLTKKDNKRLVIATSSLRRQAQWLYAHKNTTIENLRGNVQTRLEKLANSHWHGAIFAAAGLERLGIANKYSALMLDWMLPAPAQGAVVVICRKDDDSTLATCKQIHDVNTGICTQVEKDFLAGLLGGCSLPIGAYATVHNGNIQFKGNVVAVDGTKKEDITLHTPLSEAHMLGASAAKAMIKNGVLNILKH
jgi:hydroxymethylbilane synthase